jgi:serine/threonine protein kinase
MYGTLRYLSPEQWLYRQVSSAVDIYALGVTTIEILTAAPFERPPLMPDAYKTHIHTFLGRIPASPWSDRVIPFLARMLAHDPTDRPSAGEVHEQFLTFIEDAPGPTIRRIARDRIPPLIAARRAQFEGLSMPPNLSFSQPDIITNVPSPAQASAAKPVNENEPSNTMFITEHAPPAPPKRSVLLIAAASLVLLVLAPAGLLYVTDTTLLDTTDHNPERMDSNVGAQQTPDAPEAADVPEAVGAPEAADVLPAPSSVGALPEAAPEPRRSSEADASAPPRPRPRSPAPEPEAQLTGPLTLRGPSLDAKIYVDRELIGVHSAVVSLPYGTHELHIFSEAYGALKIDIDVGETTSGAYRWDRDTDEIRYHPN